MVKHISVTPQRTQVLAHGNVQLLPRRVNEFCVDDEVSVPQVDLDTLTELVSCGVILSEDDGEDTVKASEGVAAGCPDGEVHMIVEGLIADLAGVVVWVMECCKWLNGESSVVEFGLISGLVNV